MLETIEQWDRKILLLINGLGLESWDPFWLLITKPQTWIPFYLFLIYLLFKNNSVKVGFRLLGWTLLTALTANFASFLTKILTQRSRPNNEETLSELLRILQHPDNYSFFSGHAATSFAVSTLIILLFRDKSHWIYLILIWPVLFSFSRLYAGVHYPSDVITGMLVGIGLGYIFHHLYRKIFGDPNTSSTPDPANG